MIAYTRKLFKAIEFASWQHRFQRRKGCDHIPYINHPLRVAGMLAEYNDKILENMLLAAVLHDVVEDTGATESDIRKLFGKKVAMLVMEVTDDMSLPSAVRKQKQIEKAPKLSNEAKQIKIADKICNIQDMTNLPVGWTDIRKMNYIEWSKKVVKGCRGVNARLEKYFDRECLTAISKIKGKQK